MRTVLEIFVQEIKEIMRTIKMYCKKCNVKLTEELKEMDYHTVTFPDEANAIPHGRFTQYEYNSKISILISREEHFMKNHANPGRFSGCCGSDGSNGMNKLCVNGHEVATEVSDCYTSYYIRMHLKNVVVKEKDAKDSFKEVKYKYASLE